MRNIRSAVTSTLLLKCVWTNIAALVDRLFVHAITIHLIDYFDTLRVIMCLSITSQGMICLVQTKRNGQIKKKKYRKISLDWFISCTRVANHPHPTWCGSEVCSAVRTRTQYRVARRLRRFSSQFQVTINSYIRSCCMGPFDRRG